MQLTDANYYSPEANMEYMSVSMFKQFAGTLGSLPCEAKALAVMRGEWQDPPNRAMLMGSYVDHYFEGTLPQFREEHPEIFTRSGELRSEFKQCEEIIRVAENDPVYMAYMSGDKQTIMTGEICGVPWKIKMDSYKPGLFITDQKVMASLTEAHWVRDMGYIDFVRYWGYDIQGAVYQEIVRQNTGYILPFYIAGLSKETPPDKEVIYVAQPFLDEAMDQVEGRMPRIKMLRSGEEKPFRCEKCAYCRATKRLKGPIGLDDIPMKL